MLLRTALRKNSLKLTALTTVVALVLAPMAALAQENRGPPVLRDAETEALHGAGAEILHQDVCLRDQLGENLSAGCAFDVDRQ